MKDILNFINGEYVKCASGKTFEKRMPIVNRERYRQADRGNKRLLWADRPHARAQA
jgi:hypothetical protein